MGSCLIRTDRGVEERGSFYRSLHGHLKGSCVLKASVEQSTRGTADVQ